MEEYNQLKKEINDLLNKKEIKQDETYISAYELKNTIANELQELYNVYNSKNNKVYLINKKNAIKRFFNKDYPILNFIFFETEDNGFQKIEMHFKNESSVEIKKHKDSENIFFEFHQTTPKEKEMIKNIIKDNIDFVINTFDTLEYYYKEYEIKMQHGYFYIVNNIIQTFNYQKFNINFNFQREPEINITLEDEELNKVYKTNWLILTNLSKYVKDNIDEFTKRIPIKKEELNPIYRQIVNKSLVKPKIKQLKK